MPPKPKDTNSKKPTLLSTHPQFTATLVDILSTEFKTIRRFAELSDINPTYFYTLLRDDNSGVIPRLQTVTHLMKTVKEHAPHRFDALWEALRADIEAAPEFETLEDEGSGRMVEAKAKERKGEPLPRPSVAKRFSCRTECKPRQG